MELFAFDISTEYDETIVFKLPERLSDICDATDWHAPSLSGACFERDGGDLSGTVFGNDDSSGPKGGGTSNDGPQIMGILNLIENDEKGLCRRMRKDIVKIGVRERPDFEHNALMTRFAGFVIK
jgi:hypothetical protein